MTTLRQGIAPDDFLVAHAVRAVPGQQIDGRLPGHIWARVVDIKDPDGQGRIKCRFFWEEEEGVTEMDTDWISRVVRFSGPTRMSRDRIFGENPPHPEVGSLAILACMSGDIHDLIYVGQPEYQEGELGAPPSAKDDHTDWAFRMALPNGWEWGVDTEGNEHKTTPGNYRHRILGSGHISARGMLTLFAPMVRIAALGMLRFLAGKIESSNWSTPEEKELLREMMIDAMKGPPGYEDPGIGKVEDLE